MPLARAILAGWAALVVSSLAVERPLLWAAAHPLGSQWFPTARVSLDCLLLAAAGCLTARLHRRAPLAALLAFAATLSLWDLDPLVSLNVPWLLRFGFDALRHGAYLNSFANTAVRHLLLFASLLAGGFRGRPVPKPVSILPAVLVAFLLAPPAPAQTRLNDRVLVVYNAAEPGSLAVARYYAMRRAIPEDRLCKISPTSPDAVPLEEYESALKPAIRKCLEAVGKQTILYVVFSYLTPYKVTIGNSARALDQMVADIWDEYMSKIEFPPKAQPYFADAESEGDVYIPFVSLAAYRARPMAAIIYSVWRLDAANLELAKGLVEKAMAAEAVGLHGHACFDRRYGLIDAVADDGYGSGDWDLFRAAAFARLAGFPVTEDDHPQEFGNPPAPKRCDDAALYAGWYSLNHYYDAFSWAPGAIGIHLDSYSALNPRAGPNWVANALLKGITLTAGAVGEPLLAGLPHPDQFFLYLFGGANAGDAMLRSTRWIKWMIINIGDPLYRPFPQGLSPFRMPGFDRPQLVVFPQGFIGGMPAQVIFHLTVPSPAGGTKLTFKSDHPELVAAPEAVSLREGTNTARFQLTTRPVTAETAVRITVAGAGITLTNTLVLHPAPAPKPAPIK
ncbi:MAG TPA: TIGR03790 family protein [Bryobacteraceae bacterium]|nr:TIGR03790 family protein [Bryobacteraceae bacterium]